MPESSGCIIQRKCQNSYISEAYFLRSLAYYYLVRLWKDVPFVQEPYVDDTAP
jgi:hypothetical protein